MFLNAAPSLAQGTARSLDIQPGARQNGLGAAGVALLGNAADALWWNPAALGFANETSAQYTHANLLPGLADLPHHHVAVGTPLGTIGGFGASFTHLNYDDFGSSFESSQAIALGVRVHPIVSLGATLKWVDMTFIGATANGATSDIAVLVMGEQGPWLLGFGAMYQNLGGRFDFGSFSGSYPPSRNYKVGVSASRPFQVSDLVTAGCTAVIDYNRSDVSDDFRTWHGGVEGQLTYDRVLRGAVRVGYYSDPLGDIEDLTFGIGARAWMVSVDAGWIPQAEGSDLDRVMKITAGVHVNFSGERPGWDLD
jgi:hypothetical protein